MRDSSSTDEASLKGLIGVWYSPSIFLGRPEGLRQPRLAAYRTRQDQVNERNTSLLRRKLEKAKYGDALGTQIERLVSEKDVVASLSGSSK